MKVRVVGTNNADVELTGQRLGYEVDGEMYIDALLLGV